MGHGKIAFSAAVLASIAPFALGAIGCKGGEPPARAQDPSSSSSTTTTTSASAIADGPAAAPAHAESFTVAAVPSPTPVIPPATTPAGAAGATTGTPPLSDAEIVAIVDAAGRGERLEAHEAMKKASGARVRQLAQLVLSDHDSAKLDRLERVTSLAPAPNALSEEIGSSRAHTAEQLKSAASSDFDRAYIAAQMAAGRHMIELLDDRLIPQAQNGELRTFLQDLRTSTASNLGMARDIKARIAE
jgi:putative membrane protein